MVSQADSKPIISREEIADIFGVPVSLLPPLTESLFEKLARIHDRWAAESIAVIISAIPPEELKPLLDNRRREG